MYAFSLCFLSEEQKYMNFNFLCFFYVDYEPVYCVQGEGTLHVVQPYCSAQQEDRDAGPDPYW
jgi:hypothetical protein